MLPITNPRTLEVQNANSSNLAPTAGGEEPHWADNLHARLQHISKAAIEEMPSSPITALLLEGKVPQTQVDFELCVNFLALSHEYEPVLSLLLQNTAFEALEVFTLPHTSCRRLLECLEASPSLLRLTIRPFSGKDDPEFARACPIQAQVMQTTTGEGAMPLDAQDCVHLGNYLQRNGALKHLVLIGSDIGSAGAGNIAQGLANSSSLEFLKISQGRVGDRGALALGKAIAVNASLEILSLAFAGISASGTAGLAQGLIGNAKVSSLTLSGNLIGDEGVHHLVNALKCRPQPIALNLGGIGLTISGVRELSSALGDSDFHVQGLLLSGNQLGDAGAVVLGRALSKSRAEWLDLSRNEIGPEGATALGKMLASHPRLLEFDLSTNPIGDGASTIGEALKTNAMLQTLDLTGCGIDAAGFTALGKGLQKNLALTELSLASNAGGQGASAVLQALGLHPKLEILSLSNNALPAVCFEAAGKALAVNKNLRILEMKGNLCGDEGAMWLAQGLKSNGYLQELDLGRNELRRTGAETMFQALTFNTSLEYLNLSSNQFELDRGVLQALKGLLAGNRKLEVLHLQGNPFKSSMAVDQLAVALRGNTVMLAFELGAFPQQVALLIEPILSQNRLLATDPARKDYLVGAAIGMMHGKHEALERAGAVMGEYLFAKGELQTLGSLAQLNKKSRDAAEAAYKQAQGDSAN